MENSKRIVGLTGGMGAGKSTLVNVFLEAGITVWDADKAVHELYETPGFAEEIYEEFGVRTRAEMAKMVTESPACLPTLEIIASNWLEATFQIFMDSHEDEPFVVIDVPLLYEQKWNTICDYVVIASCPRAIREERVTKRPGMTPEKMKLLMDHQVTDEFRASQDAFFIDTTTSIEDSRAAMVALLERFKEIYS